MKILALFPAVLLLAACEPGPRAAEPGSAGLAFTIGDLLDIKHPSGPVWSPDGQRIVFIWDRAGVSNLYVSDLSGGEPRALTSETGSGVTSAPFWSRDGKLVYFAHRGDLWQVAAVGGTASPAWTTPAAETDITCAPDGTRVAFTRQGAQTGSELVVRMLEGGAERVVARDEQSIGGLAWSPDGQRIAYTAGSRSIRHEQTPEYSGAKIIYTVTERVPGRGFVVGAAGGAAVPIREAVGGTLRWLGNDRVVFDRQSADFKRRSTFVVDAATGAGRLLHEEVDEKFWSIPANTGAAAQPSPDGKWIAFLSDRDGWDHLYVMPAGGGEPLQVTKGEFEAWRPRWSPDSTRIAFDANLPGKPGTRQLGVATIAAGAQPQSAVTMITDAPGTHIAPEWSPDGARLVYQHTDPRTSADLFVVAATGGQPTRLSTSLPASIAEADLVAPEFVTYPGPDGKAVPGWLFVPNGLDRSKRHPAIVWIHGDGVNQNYDGWHVQRNYAVYYSFHQYLLQQGFVVFAPDYRGSIGYGRDWRQGVYMDVGGKDAQDAWMAANYLKTLPYVDADRMGVWGLSYGGFFTLIAVTDQPTLFRAGVDVAGVVDYAMYYEDPYHGSWTASRIGTPEQNPAVYKNASPLSHVDRLQRPLLVLHGTSDVNVPYLHSVRLADELLKHGKGELFEFMTYPGEFHYFTRAHVLQDAWSRVERFFTQHLVDVGGGAATN
jgi:dipeptidyl aminopeptidase/acylaminoacyl peptidase